MTKDERRRAERPDALDGRQYHLETRPGDLAAHCLLVGAPERAEAIASTLLTDAKLVGHHRGLRSYTGRYLDLPMSVVTTGMGGPSIGIILPEAVASGARTFIRVGTCSALRADVPVGSVAIATGAVRLDGASEDWAIIEYPAVADYRTVAALVAAAQGLGISHAVGIGATTACFNEGQARHDRRGYLPERLAARHAELIARDVLFYSMEEAALFVWCSTHGQGITAGSVCAVIGNRVTDDFRVCAEMDAAAVAAAALLRLAA